MKAIRLTAPYHLEIAEVPKPAPKPGEALLRVLYCGICGADVASFTGNQPFTTYPRIPGHEFSAQVVSVPENDRGIRPGDKVTCNPYFNCGACYACQKGLVNACVDNQTMGVQRDGAFCEYIVMPVERIIPGRGLDEKQLALIEPFSISWHALHRCEIRPGSRVLVIGAGPIGLFALRAAAAQGAAVTVCDVLDGRLKLARALGAEYIVNTAKPEEKERLKEYSGGWGFDTCVEACGRSETFLMAIDQAAQGANLILIGNGKTETTFLHSILLKKELNVYGSRNAYTRDFEQLIDLVAAGDTDVMRLVSAVYGMEEAEKAFDSLSHNDGSLEKILLRFAEPEGA